MCMLSVNCFSACFDENFLFIIFLSNHCMFSTIIKLFIYTYISWTFSIHIESSVIFSLNYAFSPFSLRPRLFQCSCCSYFTINDTTHSLNKIKKKNNFAQTTFHSDEWFLCCYQTMEFFHNFQHSASFSLNESCVALIFVFIQQ